MTSVFSERAVTKGSVTVPAHIKADRTSDYSRYFGANALHATTGKCAFVKGSKAPTQREYRTVLVSSAIIFLRAVFIILHHHVYVYVPARVKHVIVNYPKG